MSNEGMEIKFWEDKAKDLVNPLLFSEVAHKYAEMIYEEGKEGKRYSKKNNISQLRRFYDTILNLDNTLQSMEGDINENFKKLLPYLKMLKPLAYYSLGREHITKLFKDFIETCLNNVHDYKDFKVLKTFFEAFMGYYRYYSK